MSRRLVDLAWIVGAWAAVAFVAGSQPFTTLNTPDAEFHATMAIFTHEVTGRAAIPVYYWTRLGYIAPVNALTEVLGPIGGLEAYRLILMLIIVAALYAMLRPFVAPVAAAALSAMLAANTVVLTMLGNTYPTATIMAGMMVLSALALREGVRWPPLAAGVTLGWLVMNSPYAAVLSLVLYSSLALGFRGRRLTWASVLSAVGFGALGLLASFLALLAVGRLLFPGLDWLSTYLFWNSALDQSDYVFDLWQWTRDPSMLVVAMGAAVAIGAWLMDRHAPLARSAALAAVLTPLVAWGYWLVNPNPFLELPNYQAMLWPAALVGIALATASRLPAVDVRWPHVTVAMAGVASVVLAGHLQPSLGTTASRVLAVGGIAAFLLLRRRWVLVLLGAVIVLMVAQVLQNARGTFGVSTQDLYVNAFRPNETRQMLESAVRGQEWVLGRTSPGDRTLTWVDAEWPPGEQYVLPLAAFQLWGANEAEHGPVVTDDTITRWEGGKPLSLALYGKTLGAVLDFWNTIPKERRPTVPECLEVPWPRTGTAQVCVTRLTW